MNRQNVFGSLVFLVSCLVTIWVASPIVLAACSNMQPNYQGCSVGATGNCTKTGNTCSGNQVERQDGYFGCKSGSNTDCVDGLTKNEATCTITYACIVQPDSNPVICVSDHGNIITSSDQLQKVSSSCGT